MGTVFNRVPGAFGAVLEALDRSDLDVIVTVGDTIDPSSISVQRPNIRIEQYIPQSMVLPRVNAVVTHGGYNTMIAALTHGLPMLCLPLGADQPYNAFRLEAAGVAIRLDPLTASASQLRAAIDELLNDPQFTLNAQRLQTALAALPPVTEAVPRLETLAKQ